MQENLDWEDEKKKEKLVEASVLEERKIKRGKGCEESLAYFFCICMTA